MELDQFKKEFNEFSKNEQQPNTKELAALLKQKPLNGIHRMKLNLKMELGLSLILIIAATIVMFSSILPIVKWLTAITIGISIIFIYLGWQLLLHTRKFESSEFDTKQYIVKMIALFEKFTHQYYLISIALLPLLLLLGLAFNIYHLPSSFRNLDYILQQPGFIWYGVLSVIWAVLMYFFTRWYLQNLYGKHIKQLKALLNELGDTEHDVV